MNDNDKKKTACLFITLPERVTVNNNGGYEYTNENAKKYFEKFREYYVVPLDLKAPDLIKDFCIKASQQKIDNVQVIFDIHGDKDTFSLQSSLLTFILVPLFTKLTARNLDIIMAHCQGSENVQTIFGTESLNTKIKELNKIGALIGYGKNVSLYYMPKGHDANITFTKNGDIFFISADAERAVSNQYNLNDVLIERFYKKQNQKDHEHDLQIVHKDGCWNIPAEKPGEKNILNGIFKDRPPRKYDNAPTLKPILKTYPKRNVTKNNKVTYKKLDLNLEKKGNKTIKK